MSGGGRTLRTPFPVARNEEVNADGLCSSSGVPCGCSTPDLMNCMKPASEIAECVPARRVPCAHEQCNHYLHGPCEATADTEWCYVPWPGKGEGKILRKVEEA